MLLKKIAQKNIEQLTKKEQEVIKGGTTETIIITDVMEI